LRSPLFPYTTLFRSYWRSDAIVGLMPIEEDRGPRRRTNVFVDGHAEPIVASRTEQSILEDMGATDETFQVQSLREAIAELLAARSEEHTSELQSLAY